MIINELITQIGSEESQGDVPIKIIDRKTEHDVLFVEEKLTRSKLFFVLEGKFKLKINKLDVRTVEHGNIALVPCNSFLIASIEPGSFVMTVSFSEKEPFGANYSLVNLMHDSGMEDGETCNAVTLPINERITAFVRSTLDCIADGMAKQAYFKVKKQEMFLLMLHYYSREQLSQFFYPLFCFNRKFEQMVLSNFENVTDVKHFAAIMHMPVTTFQRKFRRHFKTSVKQWLLDRKAERMLADIKTTNRSITDLSQRYGFSSVSYFSNFCKHYFGKTPTELRAEDNRDD